MGLINRLLPGAELVSYVQDYATTISANAANYTGCQTREY